MRSKIISFISILLGCGLIIFSAAMFISNISEKKQTESNFSNIVNRIEAVLPSKSTGTIEEFSNNTMPVLEIDGKDFSGIIEFPDYNVKLPIYAEWSSKNNYLRPAIYMGSVYDGSIVIGLNHVAGKFEIAESLDIENKITVTDMTGHVFTYKISSIKHSDTLETESLTSDENELILFVKIKGKYLVIRCNVSF